MNDPTAPADGTFYDRAYRKWLTTNRNAVSDDGSRYAYEDGPGLDPTASGTLHVVDVATGADHIIYSGSPVFIVIGFTPEGIYVTSAAEDVPRGLWVINPSGGQPRLISSTILQPAVGDGAAWGLGFNSADPNPGEAGIMGPQNEVLRYSLGDGSSTQWFYQPGASFWMEGLDYSGNLFVDNLFLDPSGTGTYDILEIGVGATSRVVFDGNSEPTYTLIEGLAAVDSFGTWFDGRSEGTGLGTSIWLASGGRLQEVAAVTQENFSIAGGCIPSGS